MLTPDEIEAVVRDITDVYSEVELSVIRSISRAIMTGSGISDNTLWHMKKLNDIGALRKSLIREVSVSSGKSIAEVRKIVSDAIVKGMLNDNRMIANLSSGKDIGVHGIDGLLLDSKEVLESPAFQRVYKVVTAKVERILNYTGTMAVESGINSYRTNVNRAFLETATGTYTREQAVVRACRRAGSSGVTVEFVSDAGRVTHQSLDSCVRRDVVTSINQACAELTVQTCEDIETDLVETTWHVGARPEHEVWQGRIFSLSGKSDKYPDFRSSTGYGEIDGLCGINCRHSFFPYFEGMPQADQTGKPSASENARQYQLQQKQREYERNIRAMKRRIVAEREIGDRAGLSSLNGRLDAYRSEYRRFLSDNGLVRQTFREQI